MNIFDIKSQDLQSYTKKSHTEKSQYNELIELLRNSLTSDNKKEVNQAITVLNNFRMNTQYENQYRQLIDVLLNEQTLKRLIQSENILFEHIQAILKPYTIDWPNSDQHSNITNKYQQAITAINNEQKWSLKNILSFSWWWQKTKTAFRKLTGYQNKTDFNVIQKTNLLINFISSPKHILKNDKNSQSNSDNNDQTLSQVSVTNNNYNVSNEALPRVSTESDNSESSMNSNITNVDNDEPNPLLPPTYIYTSKKECDGNNNSHYNVSLHVFSKSGQEAHYYINTSQQNPEHSQLNFSQTPPNSHSHLQQSFNSSNSSAISTSSSPWHEVRNTPVSNRRRNSTPTSNLNSQSESNDDWHTPSFNSSCTSASNDNWKTPSQSGTVSKSGFFNRRHSSPDLKSEGSSPWQSISSNNNSNNDKAEKELSFL